MSTAEQSFSKAIYFPTMVFQIDVANPAALNDNLLKTIYKEREKDQAGITRSNYKELGGWHSQNFLHRSKNYSELVGHVNKATASISDELGYSKDHKMTIGTMWSIINPPGSANKAHVHPGCLWSGVYYIQAPKKSGNIEFTEPRTVHLMNQPTYLPKKKRPRNCWTKVNYTPRPGRMIIFPSWLYHAVNPNMSDETGDDANRVIISFNVSQRSIQSSKNK